MSEDTPTENQPPVPGPDNPSDEPLPDASQPMAGEAEGASGMLLSSTELAALYIRQGDYARGIDVFKQLLTLDPNNEELQQCLKDAETLAGLLTLQGDPGSDTEGYDKGFQEGYDAARSKDALPKEERISRLNEWLERIQDRAND